MYYELSAISVMFHGEKNQHILVKRDNLCESYVLNSVTVFHGTLYRKVSGQFGK